MGRKGDALRAEVVEALRASEGPLTAYEILDVLRQTHPKAAPTTVYRALEALSGQHLIHRLETLNAYVLCNGTGEDHDAILSICADCGTVEETVAPEVLQTMTQAVSKSGFAPTRHVVELHGTCAECTPEKRTS